VTPILSVTPVFLGIGTSSNGLLLNFFDPLEDLEAELPTKSRFSHARCRRCRQRYLQRKKSMLARSHRHSLPIQSMVVTELQRTSPV